MITTKQKQKITAAIFDQRKRFPSDKKLAVHLGLATSQLSNLKKGQFDNQVSDAKWITIARKLDVKLFGQQEWKTAKTPVFEFVNSQLAFCQDNSQSGLLCDRADIGKTYSARCYVREHKNAIYIDCAQVKSKQKLIRQIASEYGLSSTGRYADVYEDLIYFLRSIESPLIVLDEAGDLDYPAFLELKALWNATERSCGWYMMGADGLKQKIETHLGRKKVGYAELFSRFGNRFQKISPDGEEAWSDFIKVNVQLIARANYAQVDVKMIYRNTGGSLRRIPIEIQKQKAMS